MLRHEKPRNRCPSSPWNIAALPTAAPQSSWKAGRPSQEKAVTFQDLSIHFAERALAIPTIKMINFACGFFDQDNDRWYQRPFNEPEGGGIKKAQKCKAWFRSKIPKLAKTCQNPKLNKLRLSTSQTQNKIIRLTLGTGGSPGSTWLMLRMKLRVGWGGVAMITFFALAHMLGATQHHVSCTCTHGRCYATSCFLHLPHMLGATQHHVSCTCTHGRCYATSCFLHLHTWSVLRNIMFLALAHMVGATQHHVSCTCTHGRRYATSCFLHLHTWSALRNIMFLALAHMVGATQHHGVGWGGVRMITFLALAHMVGATKWNACLAWCLPQML